MSVLRTAVTSATFAAAGVVGVAGGVLPAPGFTTEAVAEMTPAVASWAVDASRAASCDVMPADVGAVSEIESGHGTHGGASPDAAGDVRPMVFGPWLDGRSAAIGYVPDTDGGAIDGGDVYDRAVGPMQFIPSTWRSVGTDGNGDGVADPHNYVDALASAAELLCRNGYSASDDDARWLAFRRYNGSGPAAEAYADEAIATAARYAGELAPEGGAVGVTTVGALEASTASSSPGVAIVEDLWSRFDGARTAVGSVIDPEDAPTLAAAWRTLNAPLDSYLDSLGAGAGAGAGAAASTRLVGAPADVEGMAWLDASVGCRLDARAVPLFRSLIEAAAADGVELVPGSCLRPHDVQIRLRTDNGCRDVWTAPPSSCRVPTAIPGTSNHEIGFAVDFRSCSTFRSTCGRWLSAHAGEHGLYQLRSEAWHVEVRKAEQRARGWS